MNRPLRLPRSQLLDTYEIKKLAECKAVNFAQ
jgi:hypothetical protein